MGKKNKKSEDDSLIQPKETNKNIAKHKKKGNRLRDKEQRVVNKQQDEK